MGFGGVPSGAREVLSAMCRSQLEAFQHMIGDTMVTQGKVWGQTRCIFASTFCAVHRIVGRATGYCSVHTHRHKFNRFYVEAGALRIRQWRGNPDETVIREGEVCDIPPGVAHQFEVMEDGTVAYEIYWVELEESDIERTTQGGIGNG